MKKTALIITVILSALLMQSFHSPGSKKLKNVMKEYRHEQGVMFFAVPAWIIRPFIPAEEETAKALLKDVKMFRILITKPEARSEVNHAFANDMNIYFGNTEQYKDLLTVISPDEQVSIKAREENGNIMELIIFVNSPDETVCLQVTGNINLNKISEATSLIADAH